MNRLDCFMCSLLAVGCILTVASACRAPAAPPPEDLDDGAQVIREMMSPRRLETAGFYGAHPEAKPSDFLSFINSEMGVVLWPPREGSPLAGELELEQSRTIGETVLPKGIAFKRNRPDPNAGRQIVYRADDDNGEIIVEAYADPSAEPVFVRRWKFP